MKSEQLIKVFKVFFPDVQLRSILDDDNHLEISCTTEEHIKYSALYIKQLNYIKVQTYNLSVVSTITTHVEGNVKDICKLVKSIEE